MREKLQRKDRVCIRPELSRTHTFGKTGVSHGQFYEQHLKFNVLNKEPVDFSKEDLSYLQKVYTSDRKSVRATITLYPIGRPVRATITLYPIGRPVRTTITLYPIGRLLELLLHCIL